MGSIALNGGECTLSSSGFRQLIHSAFFLAILVATGAPLYAQNAVDWRKDLEFLRDEIPKRHKNVLHFISELQFENEIDTLEARLAQVSRSEVILDVARIVASIGDGHTQMFLNADEKVGFHQLPVRFYWFREGIYVIAAEEQNRWAIGKRVSKIGNVAIMEAITRVAPVVSRDNEMTIRDVLPNDLCLAEVLYYLNLSNDGSAAAFEIDVDGETRILRVSVPGDMNLASRLEQEPHATFVGEHTGSRPNHYGEAVTLTLPASGITVRVSTRYWRDSKPNDKRLWIAPEMPAPPSAVRLVAESIRLWIRFFGNSGTTTIPGRLTLPYKRMDVYSQY